MYICQKINSQHSVSSEASNFKMNQDSSSTTSPQNGKGGESAKKARQRKKKSNTVDVAKIPEPEVVEENLPAVKFAGSKFLCSPEPTILPMPDFDEAGFFESKGNESASSVLRKCLKIGVQ